MTHIIYFIEHGPGILGKDCFTTFGIFWLDIIDKSTFEKWFVSTILITKVLFLQNLELIYLAPQCNVGQEYKFHFQ